MPMPQSGTGRSASELPEERVCGEQSRVLPLGMNMPYELGQKVTKSHKGPLRQGGDASRRSEKG
eukprot:3562076-Amphidinium_carterae.1